MALMVRNLSVEVAGRRVLNRVSLSIGRGEIVALMGPNGSGKTSLAYALAGHPGYRVVEGEVLMDGEDLLRLPPHERSLRGLTLAFQDPVEIPGLRLRTLLAAALAKRGSGRAHPDAVDPSDLARAGELARWLGLGPEYLDREVNRGFSGGEKRAEILQVLLLKPRYAVLDEPDSGLDVDGVRRVADAIEMLRRGGAGMLLITHYTRILRHLKVDRVAVLVGGRIVAEGGEELARLVEEKGYEALGGGG